MKNNTARMGRGPRRDISKERFWRTVMRRFAVSGQSVRAYCQSHDLSEVSFYFWRRTLAVRDAALAAGTGPASRPAFVPVRITTRPSSPKSDPAVAPMAGHEPGRMEIVLGGGRCVRLHGPVDRQALADVLAVMSLDPEALDGEAQSC